MTRIEIAKKYLEYLFSGNDYEKLEKLMDENMTFNGPFYNFNNAASYLQVLKNAPPSDISFSIKQSFENESAVCIIYEFKKSGIRCMMSQSFEIKHQKITSTILIFDTQIFMAE